MPKTIKKEINQRKLSSLSDKIFNKANESFIQRAFVVFGAVEAFKEYLEEKGIKISGHSPLHLNPTLLERFDIADIKLKNNVVIDIRAIAGDDYPHMCIPREHFLKGIQPDIYLAIKVDKNLEHAEIIGFIKTEDISQAKGNKHYFIVEAEDLVPIADIEKTISSISRKEQAFLAIDHEKVTGMYIPFIENNLSQEAQNYLLEHLSACGECRDEFNNLSSLYHSLNNEKEKLFLEEDYTLRLLTNDPVLAKNREVEINIRDEDEEKPIDIEALGYDPLKKENPLDELERELEEEEPLEIESIEEETPEEDVLVEEPTEDFEEEEPVDIESIREVTKNEATVLKEELQEDIEEEPFEIERIKDKKPEEAPLFEELLEEDLIEIKSVEDKTTGKDVLEEEPAGKSLAEDSLEIKPKTTHTPRDWADELAANLISGQKEKKPLEEDFSATDLRKQDFEVEELKEDKLGESPLLEEPENVLKEDFKETEELTLEQKSEDFAAAPTKPTNTSKIEEKKEKKDSTERELELEDILESLDDVEILQGEEDIDNLLSFFDPGEDTEGPAKIENRPSEPVPLHQTPKQPQKSVIPEDEPLEKKDRGDIKVQAGDNMGYTSVLDTREKGNENLNFIVEEDAAAAAEVIPNEDLMQIFGVDTELAPPKTEKVESAKNIKSILKRLVEDKSVVAFTVAISLSTTVLFLYLGQINKQVQIANTSSSTSENQSTSQENENLEIFIRREREPLKSYTRQIIKVVKPEKKDENGLEQFQDEKEKVEVIKKEIASAPQELEIKSISWELTAEVARNTKVKEYFLEIGEQIKSSLAKELMIPGANVKNSRVDIYAELNSNGNIITGKIARSSGIEQIDTICLDNLKKVINKYKIPDSSLRQDKIKFILLIRT